MPFYDLLNMKNHFDKSEVTDIFSIWIKIKSRFFGWALNGKVVYLTIVWMCFLFGSFQLKAQDKLPNERGPQTYALVIGISKYADKGIDALQYAHEDANQFALYLRSQTGTEIPSKNIYLLTNQQATWSAIYQAMDDIQEKCESGDLVYFYFSGHGDIENNRIFKNGYLLSYSTPRFNYINSAIRIEDLNNFANTLSVQKNAKVILITDACHSGRLAGSSLSATALVAEQLKTVMHQEVRLSSCLPEEVSFEDRRWGGGRSIFSYYLLKGLKGQADLNNDQKVTVKDLQTYLVSAFENDHVLKAMNEKQTPVVKGQSGFVIGEIDSATLNKNQWQDSLQTIYTDSGIVRKSLPKRPSNPFQIYLDRANISIELLFPYRSLLSLPQSDIHRVILDSCIHQIQAEIPTLYQPEDLKRSEQLIADLKSYQNNLDQNPDALKRFYSDLMIRLSNRGQEVINLYTLGDEEELEKLRYYKALSNHYEDYADMIEFAYRLAEPNKPSSRNLQIYKHYFRAVAHRINLFKAENQQQVLQAAYENIQTALNLENKAAYLHLEAGLIDRYLGNLDSAFYHFRKATQISPNWFVPWRYLSTSYFAKGQIDSSRQAIKVATQLNPEFPGILNHQAQLAEYDHEHLKAEQYYYTSIKKNGNHYYPFERLGFLQIHYLNFALADSNLYEAERRKAGFNFPNSDVDTPVMFNEEASVSDPPIPSCELPDSIHNDDPILLFLKGYEASRIGNYAKAIEYYQRCMMYHPKHPLAFHYLGRVYHELGQFQEAAFVFKIAQKNYLHPDSILKYCNDHKTKIRLANNECAMKVFHLLSYPFEYDYYLLGNCHEKLNSYHRATSVYAELLQYQNNNKIGFFKLLHCYETTDHWKDAYELFNNYPNILKPAKMIAQKCAFFRRMDTLNQLNSEWAYEAARFHDQYVVPISAWPIFDLHKPYSEPNEDDLWSSSKGTEILIPITKTGIKLVGYAKNAIYRTLYFFRKTANTTLNRSIESDSYLHIAGLFEKMNVPDSALLYYRKSLRIDTAENLRDKLILVLKQDKWPYDVMLQMDTLKQQGKLEFEQYMHYADAKSKNNLFAEAESILADYLKVDPTPTDASEHLLIRIKLAQSNTEEGLRRIKEWMKNHPNDFQMMYALSRILCEQQKQNESLTWLQKALDSGFNYYWVLQYDTVWQKLRNTPEWKALTAKISRPEITEYIPTR